MLNYNFLAAFCSIFFATSLGKQLLVYNNGPATLDGRITFFSTVVDYSLIGSLCYYFTDGTQNHSVKANETNVTFTSSFPSDLYTAGTYLMISYITDCTSKDKIVSNQTTFDLQEYLIGKLTVNRDSEGLSDVDEVAVGENITIAVELYDPNGYLEDAKLSYMWSIDYEPQFFVQRNLTYIYRHAGVSRIASSVSALMPNNVYKYGLFDKKLTVEDPIGNVNISGKTFLYHGDMLSLNITCNGSSLYRYCDRPLKPDEVASNFSCNPIVSNTCNFHIEHYFRNYGKYQYGIIISNDVKTVKRIVDILVYNKSKTPQLSTVIIPIVCSLLTLCIIAGGIAFYIQQRSQLTTEVANFDFQEDSFDSYGSSTFFERIFQSFSCYFCNYGSVSCGGNELCEDEEDEPLIGSSRNSA